MAGEWLFEGLPVAEEDVGRGDGLDVDPLNGRRKGYGLLDPRFAGSMAFDYGGTTGASAESDVARFAERADRARAGTTPQTEMPSWTKPTDGILAGTSKFAGFTTARGARAAPGVVRHDQTTSRDRQNSALLGYKNFGHGETAGRAQLLSGIQQAADAQQAVAAGARGGSNARRAAVLRGQAAAGGLIAAGTAQVNALQAQEQQAGLEGYGRAATSIRKQDLEEQAAAADAAEFDAWLLQKGREHGDTVALSNEGLGFDVTKTAGAGKQAKQRVIKDYSGMRLGGEAAKLAIQNQRDSNVLGAVGTGIDGAGKIAGAAISFLGQDNKPEKSNRIIRDDPY